MIGKKIEKLIVKEIEVFYDEYKKEVFEEEDDEGTVEKDLIQKLIAHFSLDKKKQVSKTKISEEERCIAITSKKTQCTSRRVENNLCKIHLTKGTTHGVLGEVIDDEEDSPKKSKKPKKNENPCQYMFQKGKQAGMKCSKNAEPDNAFCKKHTVGQPEIVQEDAYVSEKNTSEQEDSDDN